MSKVIGGYAAVELPEGFKPVRDVDWDTVVLAIEQTQAWTGLDTSGKWTLSFEEE